MCALTLRPDIGRRDDSPNTRPARARSSARPASPGRVCGGRFDQYRADARVPVIEQRRRSGRRNDHRQAAVADQRIGQPASHRREVAVRGGLLDHVTDELELAVELVAIEHLEVRHDERADDVAEGEQHEGRCDREEQRQAGGDRAEPHHEPSGASRT
ncbi:MAG: hypothetical protein U1F17_03945 [Burkholderiaceae bacterium]